MKTRNILFLRGVSKNQSNSLINITKLPVGSVSACELNSVRRSLSSFHAILDCGIKRGLKPSHSDETAHAAVVDTFRVTVVALKTNFCDRP